MRSAAAPARPRRAALRLRRRIRTGIAALVLGAVATTGALVALPAQAVEKGPSIKLVPGDRVITAAWSAVPGATSYTVRLSKKKSLSHARVVTTKARSVKLTKTANGTKYYVGVTANRAVITPSTVRSTVVSAKPAKGVPFPVGKVTVKSGPAENQVTVSWTGGGRANKVAVVAGSEVLTEGRTFHSGWYPATTRSITLTVPAKYRAYVGAGTGNPVWVKVVQSNGTSNAYGAFYSYARKYRPSPPGTWAFAKSVVPAADVDRLTVAELNTQSVGATDTASPINRWDQRVGRVAKLINTTSPKIDLLLTAELATNVTDSCRNTYKEPYRCAGHTQVADLDAAVPGLTLADGDTYARVLDRMDVPAWDGKVTNGAHVLYDPARLTLLEHGYYSPAMSPSDHSVPGVEGLGVSPWSVSAVGADRWLTWAKLQVKASGRVFYALAAHFPVGDSAAVRAARVQEAAKVRAAIEARAAGTPIVFGGDFNSDATRNPQSVQPVFIKGGWFDTAAVSAKSQRTGMKVSSANSSGPQDSKNPKDSGYNRRPNWHKYETSRIDYILTKNSPYTFHYANVLRLHKDGTFDKSVQGSDHNMQLAEVGIAGTPQP